MQKNGSMRMRRKRIWRMVLSALLFKVTAGGMVRNKKNVFSDESNDEEMNAVSRSVLSETKDINCIVNQVEPVYFQKYSEGPQPSTQWFCIDENNSDSSNRLEGNVESFLKDYSLGKELHLQIPSQMLQWHDRFESFIDLDSDDASLIKVVEVDRNDGIEDMANYERIGGRRPETNFEGTFRVLIIRVQDNEGNRVNQSEEQLHDDFFGAQSSMRSRYDACSNGRLMFNPSTGYNVNEGVVTVTMNYNIRGRDVFKLKRQVLKIIENTDGIGNADYGIFVMPNGVDFKGAVAYADKPGIFTYFKSMVASFPMIQVHEMGHNLDFSHSGKHNVYEEEWKNEKADPTCSMGYSSNAIYSGSGLDICFSGAKTWYTGWYYDHQLSIRPDLKGFTGELVGIDDVVTNDNIHSNHKVVIRVTVPGSTDLFVMFQRKEGVNKGLTEDADTVVITEQRGVSGIGWWRGALAEDESFSSSNWIKKGWQKLIVKVCSIKMGSPDTAHVLIYVEGLTDLNCPSVETQSPTISPVAQPSSEVPSVAQTMYPTSRPSPRPVISHTLNPTPQPSEKITVVTSTPSKDQTSTPTISFTMNPSPSTSSPSKNFPGPTFDPTPRTTEEPTFDPTPRTNEEPTFDPTPRTTEEPSQGSTNEENPNAIFLLRMDEVESNIYEPVRATCSSLAAMEESNRSSICRNLIYSEKDNLSPASTVCFKTCASYCVKERNRYRFVYRSYINDKGETVVVKKKCKWLQRQRKNLKARTCRSTVEAESIFGQAAEVCTSTCNSCPQVNPTPSPVYLPPIPAPTELNEEDPYARFCLRVLEENGEFIILDKNCQWLSNEKVPNKRRICQNELYQLYSEKENLSPASQVCFETCADYCVHQFDQAKFAYSWVNQENEIIISTSTCKWLRMQTKSTVTHFCSQKADFESIYGNPAEICTQTCDSCK